MIKETDYALERLLRRIEILETREDTPDTGWVALPFEAGWEAIAGYATPAYRIEGDWINIRGYVKRTSGTSLNVATLPQGPVTRELHVTRYFGPTIGFFIWNSDGTIQCESGLNYSSVSLFGRVSLT